MAAGLRFRSVGSASYPRHSRCRHATSTASADADSIATGAAGRICVQTPRRTPDVYIKRSERPGVFNSCRLARANVLLRWSIAVGGYDGNQHSSCRYRYSVACLNSRAGVVDLTVSGPDDVAVDHCIRSTTCVSEGDID